MIQVIVHLSYQMIDIMKSCWLDPAHRATAAELCNRIENVISDLQETRV
jgi:hypothetical protein